MNAGWLSVRVLAGAFGEVEGHGAVDVGFRHADGAAFVFADGFDQTVDVHRVAGAQYLGDVLFAADAEMLAAAGFGGYLQRLHHALENLLEDVGRYVLHQHLGLNATQERFVGQFVRVEVGREHHHELERHLELHAGGEGEVIDAPVEGDDPAIEQFARGEHLAAEVVDDQDAVVRLHLRGRDEHFCGLVEPQFQHRGGKLTADRDARALADGPSRVEQIVLERNLFVHDGVEQSDDVAVDFDGVRDHDAIVVDAQNALGNAGLAVTGAAVKEQRLVADERGS